jgi:hypothetical protein
LLELDAFVTVRAQHSISLEILPLPDVLPRDPCTARKGRCRVPDERFKGHLSAADFVEKGPPGVSHACPPDGERFRLEPEGPVANVATRFALGGKEVESAPPLPRRPGMTLGRWRWRWRWRPPPLPPSPQEPTPAHPSNVRMHVFVRSGVRARGVLRVEDNRLPRDRADAAGALAAWDVACNPNSHGSGPGWTTVRSLRRGP